MRPTDFYQSRMKLRRAQKHISEANKFKEDYLSKGVISTKLSTEGNGPLVVEISVSELPSDELPAIVGDAVHNLRAALDLLACDLVRLNGVKDVTKVYFPFAEASGGFEKMIKHRNMHLASAQVVDLLRSLKPYKGGNDLLYGLHRLDILDKHQEIIRIGINLLSYRGGAGGGYAPYHRVRRPMRETIYLYSDAEKQAYLETPGGFLDLYFCPVAPLYGDVFEVLGSLVKCVMGILDEFELLCFGATFK